LICESHAQSRICHETGSVRILDVCFRHMG
jgi:hypothetical protein